MVEFILRGLAQAWWDMFRESRPVGDVITWEDFWVSFLVEYQPNSLKERRTFKFEDLTYASCGSVDAYARRFIELSGYAPALVATNG